MGSSTENATLARTLLADLVDRGLDPEQAILFVIDGGKAGSLREGLRETLTLMRLRIGGQLAKTLCSTNPCESMIEIVRYTQRNVKRWQDGDMRKRWTAAGMLVAEQQFRRIVGYRDLAKWLVIAIERHADRVKLQTASSVTHSDTREVATV